MAIFPKFFEDFMTHIIRLNRDKEIKLFPELSINKIFGDSFVRFISDRSLNSSICIDKLYMPLIRPARLSFY